MDIDHDSSTWIIPLVLMAMIAIIVSIIMCGKTDLKCKDGLIYEKKGDIWVHDEFKHFTCLEEKK